MPFVISLYNGLVKITAEQISFGVSLQQISCALYPSQGKGQLVDNPNAAVARVIIYRNFLSMMSIQIPQWNKFASVVGIVVLLNAGIPQSAVAQQTQAEPNHQNCQITRFKPEIEGANNEWIRVEQCGGTVRLVHTRRANENRGVLGVVNVVTDLMGPTAGFSRWYDHPTTRVAFKSDRCTESIGLTNTDGCVIAGTETLVVPSEITIYQGNFMIEYTDGELVRTVTFRIPPAESN